MTLKTQGQSDGGRDSVIRLYRAGGMLGIVNAGAPFVTLFLAALGAMLAGGVVHAQHAKDAQIKMKMGEWVGEYTDIGGHRARLRFTVVETGKGIKGQFELVLATEDKPERYGGNLTGTAHGDQLRLDLHLTRDQFMHCVVTLRHPMTYAEQALFGVAEAVPSLKFGGGTLVAWKFKSN